MFAIESPQSEEELLKRAWQLAGMNFAELSCILDEPLPADSLSGKGWFGQCVEQYLGAMAGPSPQPDFIELGIELKTLPLKNDNSPKESTYICTVPRNLTGEVWESSWLCQKLSRVLWLPYQADSRIPPERRKIGTALLWSPSDTEYRALAEDWEELMTALSLGEETSLTSHQGKFLQVRPKAANAKSLTNMVNADGELTATIPRGFYLRTEFTRQILAQYYLQG